MSLREPNLFENAVQAGDAGLIGMDGSGNDPEFSQNLGSVVLGEVISEDGEEQS